MPYNYKSPGVYIEEVSGGARPIESVGTSVLAMVGLCNETIQVEEIGKGLVTKKTPTTPTLITNWTQFINTYGDMGQAVPGGYLHDAMYGFFLNGGTSAYVVGIPVPVEVEDGAIRTERVEQNESRLLTTSEAYLTNEKGDRTLRLTTTRPLKAGENVTVEVQPPDDKAEGSFNLVVTVAGSEPRTISNVTLSQAKGQRNVAEVLMKETENLLNAEILDAPGTLAERVPSIGTKTSLMRATAPVEQAGRKSEETAPDKPRLTPDWFRGSAPDRTGIAGLEAIEEVTMVACPDVVAAYQAGVFSAEDVKSVQTYLLNHCEMMQDRFAILDSPAGMGVQDMITWRQETMNFDSAYGALYYPWVKVDNRLVPPSGHVAGVYARVDGQRGVHKAPANEIVRGAIGLERNVSRNEQDHLNPIGVNCIRSFPGQGIRIWGARTLSSDARWRYINVRRLFSNIEESILQGTSWIVFEPNDQLLWSAIRRDVGAYLTTVWRSGALFGQTPEEAFFVRCDEETNPKELRDLGYCIIEVGIAPVKPAEFVVFRISHKEDGAGSASE